MTILFPAIVAVLYIATGLCHLWRREYGWALTWVAYGIANVGLIMAQSGHTRT